MKRSFSGLLLASLMCVFTLCAQGQNAVPFVNQPLIPPSVAPASSSFTLTVNGGNFTANSTVNWNGQPLVTTYVGVTRLTALVPAANVATARTANITVSNPAPSAASVPALFPVFSPASSLTFKPASTIVGYYPVSIAVADFNGDGKPDLAYINNSVDPSNSVLVSIQLGNGDGTFSQGATILQSDMTGGYLGGYILTGDFNNDGIPDLAYSASDEALQYIAVATNNGSGGFNPPTNFLGPDENGFDFVIGDFNRDGNLDVADLNYVEAKALSVFFGNGQGGASGGIFEGFLECCEFYILAGDFNGDGILDLADSENVLIGDGTGNFSAPQPPYTETPFPFLAADVNGDGIQDLVSPGTPTTVFLGNGDGTFTQKAQTNALNSVFALAADFNGDGKLDLASVDGVTAAVSIAFGNGDGTFQSPVSYPQTSVPSSLALADFNNDGYLDLAYTSGANVVVLLGGPETARVPTSVHLSSTPDPSKYGQGVTFTAVVESHTGVPSGKVTFLDAGQPLATRLISSTGEASFTIYKLSPGIHEIAAVYGGNSDFMASRSRSHGQLVRK